MSAMFRNVLNSSSRGLRPLLSNIGARQLPKLKRSARRSMAQLTGPGTKTNAANALRSSGFILAGVGAGAGLAFSAHLGLSGLTSAVAEPATESGAKEEYSFGQKLIAEAVGTGIIVGGGCGAVATMKYFNSGLGLLGVATVFGISVTSAIFATANVSGAHLNPAVTLALMANGKADDMSAADGAMYACAQMAGATIAGSINYLLYGEAIKAFEASEKIVRGAAGSAAVFDGAFGMVPNAGVGVPRALVAEIAATSALGFMIFALTDGDNAAVPAGAAPALIGTTVAMLIMQFAPVTGCGMNPARDLGPRLVTLLTGWKGSALSRGWWVYTVGPIIGAVAGGAAYTQYAARQKVAAK